MQRVLQCLGVPLQKLQSEPNEAHEIVLEISTISDMNKEALATFRQNILNDTKTGALGQSMEGLGDFLTSQYNDHWASHDAAVDEAWDQLVNDLVDLGNGEIEPEYLVKPSGPLKAALASMWRYPTFKTKRSEYGMTHDKSNPSLRMHDEKTGPHQQIRTQDRIVIRHPFVNEKKGGVPWAAKYTNWAKLERRQLEFNKQLMQHARVLVFVGRENCNTWRDFIKLESGDRTVQVQFKSSMAGCDIKLPPGMYGKTPCYYIIKSSAGVVKQLVFLAYHSQYMLHSDDSERGAYNDLIWSAACSFAGLDAAKHDAYIQYTGTTGTPPRERKRKPRAPLLMVSKRERRAGARPMDLSLPRPHCYHVDATTGTPCNLSFSVMRSLKAHFATKHLGETWDASLAAWEFVDEDGFHGPPGQKEVIVDINQVRYAERKVAENKKSQAKQKAAYNMKCNTCEKIFAWSYSGIKTHVTVQHPEVSYDVSTSWELVEKTVVIKRKTLAVPTKDTHNMKCKACGEIRIYHHYGMKGHIRSMHGVTPTKEMWELVAKPGFGDSKDDFDDEDE